MFVKIENQVIRDCLYKHRMQEDTKVNNLRGSEWHKWDLHIHTASSYDSPYR